MTQQSNQRVLFVTGGSRGIGKAIVAQFQARDWIVVACATTEKTAANSGADLCLACDVSDVKQVQSAITTIINRYGKLDAVINNAGITGENPLDTNDDNLWHDIIATNLHGTYYVCKYTLPHLPDLTGRIVNIASVLGLKGVPDNTAYCAAKHGVVGFTKALAHYAAPRKITVNAICPGWVRTDMMQSRIEELQVNEETLINGIPLRRIIEPKEIAELAYYLVSNEGAINITGQTFTVDGGVLA